MAQFKSRKARRKSVFGGGIRTRYPKPTGAVLTAEGGFSIVEPPFGDPVRQAALISRGARFTQNYGLLWARLNGSGDVDATAMPVRYKVGYPDQCFQTLWVHLIGNGNWPISLVFPNIGDSIQLLGLQQADIYIADVEPPFYEANVQNLLLGPDSTPTTWVDIARGGLCVPVIDIPQITYTFSANDGNGTSKTTPSAQYFADAQPFLQNKPLSCVDLVIELLLWGCCTLPDQIGSPPCESVGFDVNLNGPDYLAFLECCAGRWLWQMAMVETLAMMEDVENQSKGGQGGLVQSESKMIAFQPGSSATVPGPVLSPIMQSVNNLLSESAVEIVLAVIELLI